MPDTLLIMANKCLDYGFGGATDLARFKTFLNDTLRDVFARRDWTWAEQKVTLTLASATSSIAFPAAIASAKLGEIRKILTPASYTLATPTFVPYGTDDSDQFVDALVLGSGNPTKYSIWGNVFYFNRLADVQYTLELPYWTEPTPLTDNTEPPMPQYAREVLVWGALMRQALRDNDQARYQQWSTLFEDRLLYLKRADVKGKPRLRLNMPDEYGNAYD